MTVTIAESLAFVRDFQTLAGDLSRRVDVVLCPPYTALWAVAAAVREAHLHLGAQNLSMYTEGAHTGEISAPLLVDAGCRWAMIGHWEVRRQLGEDEAALNRKVHIALAAGLAPIVLVGPPAGNSASLFTVLERQLAQILAGCGREHGTVEELQDVRGDAIPRRRSRSARRIRGHAR